MKIIDFEKCGNVVRFFYGDDDCTDYWGDDWDDAPYQDNAGRVYDEYVKGYFDMAWDIDYIVYEPANGSSHEWTKEDFKNKLAPCIAVKKLAPNESYWMYSYSSLVAAYDTVRIYFGDDVEHVKTWGVLLDEKIFTEDTN